VLLLEIPIRGPTFRCSKADSNWQWLPNLESPKGNRGVFTGSQFEVPRFYEHIYILVYSSFFFPFNLVIYLVGSNFIFLTTNRGIQRDQVVGFFFFKENLIQFYDTKKLVMFSWKLAKLVEFILERYILFQDFPHSL
jgi:hypothetical protein